MTLTINDFSDYVSNSNFVFFLCELLLLAIAIAVLCTVIARKKDITLYGDNENGPTIEEPNCIVENKRLGDNPNNNKLTVFYVTFLFPNGERKEFAIREKEVYDALLVNQKGVLRYTGRKFKSFTW